MSRTATSSGKRYGVKRVCQIWEQPRSSYYAMVQEACASSVQTKPGKRGPKTAVSDSALLAAIKVDLAASPFSGEGHRKVWARLRVRNGIRVGRKRVLRIMRENNLLSPFRGRRGSAVLHDGRICTDSPNEMWGTDGARVFTVDDGWVWVFAAVEHWNAECVGWHVCKYGTRYAALEPISQGVASVFGSVGRDAARGLSLRMDHGTQYLSDHFLNQLRYWGITPSFAFVEQPQTNGVAERFNRTLKDQAIHGRIFRNVEEVRAAVKKFVDDYNREWQVEKNSFLSPLHIRQQWMDQAALARVA